ncbi:discoidin domain-containing protein [Carboxylicivirga sp. M1479]|uniref:discoidin domain-containing protein n=1 Tax=Carboxylicivirga sp. M1479 TaxID=2594476 RepID=UPI0011775638|nr:discoidin domain-containing protein [Carboxylicivirga sp. M1479]TRX71165.1 T9SS type A sorting domain-containing protein [Carboxylicivirga sp. M1479]
MKKIYKYLLAGFCLSLITYCLSELWVTEANHYNSGLIYEEEAEERPKVLVSTEEQSVNKRHQERALTVENSLKSSSGTSSYANGQITGSWEQFRFLTYAGSPYGFRIKGSVYDKMNDVLYAISHAGHIWKINRNVDGSATDGWQIMNHKYDFNSSYIDGLNKSNGSFRMIRSADYGMQYSDDEGKTWEVATGATSVAKSNEGVIVKASSGNRIHVLLKTNSSTVQVFTSDDNGESYSALGTSFNTSTYYTKLFKVHNSESVFLAVYHYSDSKVSIYEKTIDESGFTLKNTSNTSFVSLDHIFGTYHNGNYHFYVGTKYTHIYYTSDKGANWTLKQIGQESGNTNVRTVHPTKPNMIFRGYLDVNVSLNYGASFSNFGHRLGWDVHHMKFYQRSDGSYFHFIGKDFGCYVADVPESWSNYISLNNASPAQMCYDAAHGQNYNSSFTANQDRGTVGFLNSGNEATTVDVKTTDGLRVTLGNRDASVWTWMYYGSIFHRTNFIAGSSGLTAIHEKGNWWAAPMVASPNKKEDAVYLAYGNKLSKLTYNSNQQSIIETKHYVDFKRETAYDITGFAYSELNPQRWYVSVKSGVFLYSEDGGQTFTKSNYSGVLPKANDQSHNYHKNQHVIKASNIDEKTVYYAGVGNVFLISKDGGKTFAKHVDGLDVYRIRDFDLSADEKYIYAACGNAGIWVYSVDDDIWYEMNDASVPYVDFTDVEFIEKENEVKFATYGSGVLSFKVDGNYQTLVYPDNLVTQVKNNKTVELSWADNSDNEDGFIIERTNNGLFEEVGRVNANEVAFVDSDIPDNGSCQYRVKAYNTDDESFYSNYQLVNIPSAGEVSKTDWTLVSVDSEDVAGSHLASYAFDGNPVTFWFTQWSGAQPPYPHELVIDMNASHSFLGFSYMPRQDGKNDGTIQDYEFYISSDNSTWTKVSSGTWNGSTALKEVYFSESKEARYIKLVGLSGYNGTNYASCAELSLLTQRIEAKAPNKPQFVQGGRLSDTEIEMIWLDLSSDEDGFVVEQYVDDAFMPIYTSGQDITTFKLKNTNSEDTYWFRVKAFNEAGHSSYSDTLTIGTGKLENVGIYDLIAKDDFKVYPNPVENVLNINYSLNNLFSEWRLLDMSGRVMRNGTISRDVNKITLQVPNIQTGVYVIQLSGENGAVSKQIIKK